VPQTQDHNCQILADLKKNLLEDSFVNLQLIGYLKSHRTLHVATLHCKTLMSDRRAINDKLQDSVATYFRCGEAVGNQIKKGLLLSL